MNTCVSSASDAADAGRTASHRTVFADGFQLPDEFSSPILPSERASGDTDANKAATQAYYHVVCLMLRWKLHLFISINKAVYNDHLIAFTWKFQTA